MNFKGKIDFALPLVIFIISPQIFINISSFGKDFFSTIILILSVLILIVILFFGLNNYININENKMTVVYGILKRKVECNKIISINKLSSGKIRANPTDCFTMALTDRLLIKYSKYNYVIVSLENETAFIEELLKINPNIEVDLQNLIYKAY